MVYRGRVCNGRIEVERDARLPEGADVEITISREPSPPNEDADIPTLYEQLKDIIGSVPDLPEDLSANHDHYLYSVPKQR